MGIEYFVRKLRAAVQQPDTLISNSWGHFHLLSAALKAKHADNPRITNLIAILHSSLTQAIADRDAGNEIDLSKLMTVLDAIEFHLDQFDADTP